MAEPKWHGLAERQRVAKRQRVLLVLLLVLLVQMLLLVRRGSPTRVDARVAGI